VLTLYPADIETLSQDLLEDNIVSVSRQMIDKEASVPTIYQPSRAAATNGTDAAESMQLDTE